MITPKLIKNLCNLGLAYECPLTRGNIRDGLLPKNKGISINGYLDNFKEGNSKPNITNSIRLDLKKSMQYLKDQELTFIETSSGEEKKVNSKIALMDAVEKKKPDPIIARKDIGVSYHIAVTHDDHYQDITHVVRGHDLYESTHLHVLIQKLSNWPTPKYHHHPVLNNKYGDKLSKRGLDTSIRSLRNNGLTATPSVRYGNFMTEIHENNFLFNTWYFIGTSSEINLGKMKRKVIAGPTFSCWKA